MSESFKCKNPHCVWSWKKHEALGLCTTCFQRFPAFRNALKAEEALQQQVFSLAKSAIRMPRRRDLQNSSPENIVKGLKGRKDAYSPDNNTYFVLNNRAGAVKIGHARDVRARLGSLQTGSVDELELLLELSGNYERALHSAFLEDRIRGEWFRFSPRLARTTALLKASSLEAGKAALECVRRLYEPEAA